MNKKEQLEKAVVDTKAACDAADAALDDAFASAVADATDAVVDPAWEAVFAVVDAAWDAAFDAWDKARDELAEYLKEQDNG